MCDTPHDGARDAISAAAGQVSSRDGTQPQVRAWRPNVDGLVEVFHAHFVDHAYPAHTHGAWTLLIVDDGAISYDLDRHHHNALDSTVTLLPPHVAHDGRSATQLGFRKRVLYLAPALLGDELIGPAVDGPELDDALLRHRIHQLHRCLGNPHDALEAASRLALIRERLLFHLHRHVHTSRRASGTGAASVDHQRHPESELAGQLRDLIDARIPSGLSLREAARELHAHPTHLVRSFTATFGLPPHQYLTGRRVELARRLLLAGERPCGAAVAAGFYDQAHFTRHFRRYLGTSPARYATTAPR